MCISEVINMCEDMCCEPISSKKSTQMPCTCHGPMARHRYFLSREEEIEMLEKYKNELENEIKGVERRIQELES